MGKKETRKISIQDRLGAVLIMSVSFALTIFFGLWSIGMFEQSEWVRGAVLVVISVMWFGIFYFVNYAVFVWRWRTGFTKEEQ